MIGVLWSQGRPVGTGESQSHWRTGNSRENRMQRLRATNIYPTVSECWALLCGRSSHTANKDNVHLFGARSLTR